MPNRRLRSAWCNAKMSKFAHLSFDVLGYHIHTNRELGMMLRGVKPLAKFSEVRGMFPEVVERYLRMFDRHVAEGRFVRRDHIQQMTDRSGRSLDTEFQTILYALPSEVWRIDAMIRLWTNPGEWTEAHERQEGSLLGYEDWQNDIWIPRWAGRIAEARKAARVKK